MAGEMIFKKTMDSFSLNSAWTWFISILMSLILFVLPVSCIYYLFVHKQDKKGK